MSIQALRERRNALAKSLNELANKKDWNVVTDAATYDAGMAELEAIDDQIARINLANEKLADDNLKNEAAERSEKLGRDQGKQNLSLYGKWLRAGFSNLSPDEQIAVRNTMSTTTGSEGGYTVQTEVAKQLIEKLQDYAGMRKPGMSTVLRQAKGNPMSWPTTDGTSEEGELLDENASSSAADPVFGTVSIPVYKFGSKVIAVPLELLMDSEFDLEAFIRSRIAERLGRVTNRLHTVGTGSSQPRGVMVGASAGKVGTTGQTATVIYDDLVDVQHSVNAAYREAGNCKFMMADSSVRIVRKIKDAESRPIFAPGYDQGGGGKMPDRLLGDPLVTNDNVAAMAANAKSIAYGDFSKYVIRDVMDVTIFRFADSKYIEKGQVGFLGWMRSGGNLTDTAAVKYYQNSAS